MATRKTLELHGGGKRSVPDMEPSSKALMTSFSPAARWETGGRCQSRGDQQTVLQQWTDVQPMSREERILFLPGACQESGTATASSSL